MARNKIKRRLPVIFSLLTAAFLLLSIASGVAALSALRQLEDANYDSSGIAAVQLRLHYDLLLSELRLLELSEPEANTKKAVLQYDIVYQRLHSLPSRPPYNKTLTAMDREQLARITSEIDAVSPAFDAAATYGAEKLEGVWSRLNRKVDEVNLLTGRILEQMRTYRVTRRADIIGSTWSLILSALGLVMAGALFAFLLWRSQSHLQRQNAELESLTVQLTRADRAKSEFLASISHELRTPLNAIIGFSDLLKNEVFGGIGDKRYKEYAADINLSGNHLLNLINDILDLSKIEAGQFKVTPEDVDLASTIADAAKIVDLSEDRAHSRILIDIADGLSRVYADPRSLRQVLINLLSNAYKYSPAPEPIDVIAARADGGGVEIKVVDRGIGIPEQDLELVLQPFGQSRRNSDQTHEGTGLGLALSKQLIELNGGTLRLESRPGRGTTVHLWLPDGPTNAGQVSEVEPK